MAASHHYKVYAAIDFGTDGTGLAYCLPGNDEVYIHNKWKKWKKRRKKGKTNNNGGGMDDISSIKPKTAILLNEDQEFVAFGDNALRIYLNMNDDTSLLFEHFKMNLYNKPHYNNDKYQQINNNNNNDDQKNNKIQIKEKLTAVNGQQVSSSKIFTEALRHLKEQAMHVFRRNKLQIKSNTEVCWILTVPAIWDDIAKAKMREWAIAAGMIDPNLKNHLLLRYEPDCASLSIQQEILGKAKNNIFPSNLNDDNDVKVEPKLLENEVYLLVDAGGGTTDIACHQILKNQTVKELLHPSGGPWGDMHVDIYFIDILSEIFNREWINEFKKEEPNCYLELIDNFRKSKWTYNDIDNASNYNFNGHNVTIPVQFIEFMEDKLENDYNNDIDEIEDLVEQFELNGIKNGFKLDGASFKIHKKIWRKAFFDKLIDPTIDHCKKLLSHNNMKNCKYLCIVGGFGAVKYFQNRMKKVFGLTSKYKLDIIIPERPILSVLDGAARMAMNQNFIKSRVLPRTYGANIRFDISTARQNGISESYIQKNKIYNDYKQHWSVRGCFDIFSHKGEEIPSGQVITHEFCRSDPNQKYATLPIMSSNDVNPVICDGCQQLAELRVTWEPNDNNLDMSAEFHFYDTTIKVYAYTMSNPNDKKEIELNFIYD